jgi:uncharacterized lipoprotein NlpE involved in copper resistance
MNPSYYNYFSQQKAIIPIASILLFLGILVGCDNQQQMVSSGNNATIPPTVSNTALDSIIDTLSSASEVLAPHAETLEQTTQTEIRKLFRWEYKVVDLDSSTAATDLEGSLNALGNDNWECLPATSIGVVTAPSSYSASTLRFYCKRRPRGPLSYLRFVR